MNFGVVITTYNSPVWLQKVLWGYENQTDSDFEVIIADDGSGRETQEIIELFKQRGKLSIAHVWHPDAGFQKTAILNKAIVSTECDYLMFTDGDCVPRQDIIATHKRYAKEKHFCSAGYFKLNRPVSEQLKEEDIKSGRAFDYQWLVAQGQGKTHKGAKLKARGRWAKIQNRLTPTKATWNGANSSGWKKDILAVNGFDERLQYGGLDRELGERLFNLGLKGIQIRYSAICLHLDHKRSYENPQTWAKNNARRKHVKQNRISWTDYGIKKP